MGSSHRVSGYREVAETLQEQIRSGALALGSLLPTERELVDNFGVSRNTVRRALQELVGAGWAESIPNRGVTARMGPSTTRRRVVGFVDDAGVFEPHLFFALSALLQSEGLVLTHVDSAALGTEGALEYCMEQGFAAAVVWSKTINPDRARLRAVLQAMPIIAVDHALRGVDTDVVATDVYEGAQAAIRHLASLGRRQIAIVGMLDSLDTTQERFGGYLEGMFAAGLQPQPRDFLFTRTSGSEIADTMALEQRLSQIARPDALFVMQDHVMEDVIKAVSSVGVSIPSDVAVVTVGSDEPFDTIPTLGFTTVAFNWVQMAESLVDRVCSRLSDPAAPTVRVAVPAELMVRGSCGAPQSAWTSQPPLPISSALRRLTDARGQASGSDESRPYLHSYRRSGGTLQPLSFSSTSR